MTAQQAASVAASAPEATGLLPCSAAQERFWYLEQLDPGNPALNVALRLSLAGPFKASSLERALQVVIERHEVLRSRFVEVDGRIVQQVMNGAELNLSEVDIRSTPEAEQPVRVDAIAAESARHPFDLTQPGIMRATLIRLGADRGVLAITVHHIGFDALSIGVLGREVGEIAAALDAGHEHNLPDLTLQYGDYALWQSACLADESFAGDLAAWRERLKDAPYFELQPDFARPVERTSNGGWVAMDLPLSWGQRLEGEARRRSMSPFVFGAGALSAMLARCAGTQEVVIGTQVAERSHLDLEPLIGVFVNDVVLRFRTPSTATLDEHLRHAKQVVQEALLGHGVPFQKLVQAIRPARDPSRMPLFSINLVVQKGPMGRERYGAFDLWGSSSRSPGAIFDLNFILMAYETHWRMTVDYHADLFSRSTAERLLDLWKGVIDVAMDDPDRLLKEVPGLASKGAARDRAEVPARIERTLAAHPFVEEAAVVRCADGASQLCAFVVPSTRATIPLDRLPEVLGGHLEAHSLADEAAVAISVLRALPRDGSGRVERSRLPTAMMPLPPRQGQADAARTAESTDVRSRLARIWCDLLGLDQVSLAANFFDLGGHSLLTVRLMARIEQEFGQRLSVATVHHAPTLRALAEKIAGNAPQPSAAFERREDWRAVVLQAEGEGTPLISMNNVKLAYAMVERLSRPRPAAAVQIYDATRGEPLPLRSFDEIVAAYVDAIRSLQPHGPYALFGVCVHGNLALEVARQLKAAGEEVAAVVLKDVWEPRYALRVAARRQSRLLNRLHFLRVRLWALRHGDMSLPAFLGAFRRIRNSGLLDLAVRLGLMERVRFTDLDQEQEAFITYLTAARDGHRPEPYDGTVLHFTTDESPRGRAFEPAMGWDRVVTGRLITKPIGRLAVAPSGRFGLEEAARAIDAVLLPQDGAWPE